MMSTTVDRLLETSGWSVQELASQASLQPDRVEAIVAGRWLPSPNERTRIAQAFGVAIDDIDWGHTMSPRNVRYHRFGLPEDF